MPEEVDDKQRGLYQKYIVERTDGSSRRGEKHHGCGYFVLDMAHDKHAIAALEAYAESCKDEYPLLAQSLWTHVRWMYQKWPAKK